MELLRRPGDIKEEQGKLTSQKQNKYSLILVFLFLQAIILLLVYLSSSYFWELPVVLGWQVTLFLLLAVLLTVALVYQAYQMLLGYRDLETQAREAVRLSYSLRLAREERHDFNNHLAVIYGLLQLGHNQAAKDYLGRLIEENKDLGQVLNLPQPELAVLLSTKKRQARARGVELELAANLAEERLAINSVDLIKIVSNLLDNALDAAAGEPSGGRVTLELEWSAREIKIEVWNNGNPIPPAILAKIMEPGFTTKEGHSGMGLYIIKETAEIYGARMKVASAPEEGTRISVVIAPGGDDFLGGKP